MVDGESEKKRKREDRRSERRLSPIIQGFEGHVVALGFYSKFNEKS